MIVQAVLSRASQLVARVFVERAEIIRTGDLLPYHEGKRFRALGHMMLLPDQDWAAFDGVEMRIVEVIVVEKGPPPTEAQEAGRPRRARGAPDQLSLPTPSQTKRKKR